MKAKPETMWCVKCTYKDGHSLLWAFTLCRTRSESIEKTMKYFPKDNWRSVKRKSNLKCVKVKLEEL